MVQLRGLGITEDLLFLNTTLILLSLPAGGGGYADCQYSMKGGVVMLCSLSKLEEAKLQEIRKLEKKIGKSLLSFTCHDINPAIIEDDELGEIKNLEATLGVSLVAVQ